MHRSSPSLLSCSVDPHHLIVCFIFILIFSGFQPEHIAAQQGAKEKNEGSLFRQNRFKPLRIRTIDRPVRLSVGQIGYFAADINTETVALPLRSQWDFGDGHSAQGLNASHIFDKPGTFTVKFKVWNRQSADSLLIQVQVENPEAPVQIVSIGIRSGSISDDLLVQFNPVILGGEPIEFLWNFGNGEHSSGSNPVQQFDAPGTYQIELLVTNPYGQQTCHFEVTLTQNGLIDDEQSAIVHCPQE